MSASIAVSKIEGVLDCVVGSVDGSVHERVTKDPAGDGWIALAALAGSALDKAGDLLGLGSHQVVSVKASSTSWVIGFRSSNLIVVKCNAVRSATNVESTLACTDWSGLIEVPIEESELEYVSPNHNPRGRTEQKPPPSPANRLEIVVEESPRLVPPPKPIVPRPGGISAPARARTSPLLPQEDGTHVHRDLLLADLRRALVKGQLAQAESISTKLVADAKRRNSPMDAIPVPPQMLKGIASVLAGDAYGGLESLKSVEKSADQAPSLRWTSLIWCIRASASAGQGFDVASKYAHSALELAGNLDSEARAISTFELAGVNFQQGDLGDALELTRTARSLFASSSDPQLLATCWLLEARVLAAIGNHQESLSAAEHARECRPSWPPPATFIARRALRDGRLRDAKSALHPILAHKPASTEVERIHRVIEHVRLGAAPAVAANEFLELADAPPTPQNIRRLEELSDSYPKIEQFRDVFGWQLLRTGQYDSAAVIFEKLGRRTDLAEEVRSSVLLALGCLAAVGSRHAKPGAKIRAAVDAAPKNFKSSRPLPPASLDTAKSAPADFRHSEVPPAPSQESILHVEDKNKSRRIDQGGPVFSGNLQLFGLPDLLEFLRSGQRTGTLVCSSTAGIGAVHMRAGRITGAASPKTQGLRSYLVAMGVVSPEALKNVPLAPQDNKALIGGVLVKLGLASAEQVQLALRDQIRDAIKDLMGWGVGQFAFDPEVSIELSSADIEIEIDPQQTLLDIFKEIDESSKSTA